MCSPRPNYLMDRYPAEVRREWSDVALAEAHSAYLWWGCRDPYTVAMESEYQRRSRKRRRAQRAQAKWASCS